MGGVNNEVMARVAILGPGLLGGSLAMALQAQGGVEVVLWGRRLASAEEARAGGFHGEVSDDLEKVAAGADIVILATPVGVMPAMAERLAGLEEARRPRLVMDVGSVKAVLEESTAPILRAAGIAFVGAHPMCGSEQQGFSAARADLFVGAMCMLTPRDGEDAEIVEVARRFWSALGCRVRLMDVVEHDRQVAVISHLPHVVAAALVEVVAAQGDNVFDLAGGGFRDCTRVAAGPAEMWREILAENSEAVVGALGALRLELDRVEEALRSGDDSALLAFLEHARDLRSQLPPADAP